MEPSLDNEELSLKERIINLLQERAMKISEISKSLGYKQVSGTLKKTIKELLEENKIKVKDRIYYLN